MSIDIDKKTADSIIGILGRISVPIYAGTELQLALDINKFLASIASGEKIVIDAKLEDEVEAK